MTFDEWNAEPYSRTFEDAWKAGAASRDAVVESLRQQLAESEYRTGVEIGKKDGWEDCETCHGIVDGKHMEAESLRQQLSAFNDNREAAYRLHEEKCDQLRQQVTLLRGHLSAIRKNAIKRDRYWVENMADQALAATAPKEQ